MRKLLLLLLALGVSSLAWAQEIRAWQDLNFADDPDTVQAKMIAMQEAGDIAPTRLWGTQPYSSIARFPLTSCYPMSLAGADVYLSFDFYDGKLYRLTFMTRGVSASEWDATLLPEYATLRSVLRQALGPATSTRALGFFDATPGFIVWGDVWRSGGVSRRLGIYETTGYRYYTYLEVEWDWMADLIAGNEAQDRASDIDKAADGF